MRGPMLSVKNDYQPIPPAMPRRSGFYRLYQKGLAPQIVEVVIDGDYRLVYFTGSAEWVDLDDDRTLDESQCHWVGPLEPPRWWMRC